MKDLKVIREYNDKGLFEIECNKLIEEGYLLYTASCACNGQSSDECYQAIFISPSVKLSPILPQERTYPE